MIMKRHAWHISRLYTLHMVLAMYLIMNTNKFHNRSNEDVLKLSIKKRNQTAALFLSEKIYYCRNRTMKTSIIVLVNLIRTCSEGPAVSLNGSPTVSPTTPAL